MGDRFSASSGGGFRGNTADFGASASSSQRGSFDSEQNPSAEAGQEVLSSQLPGNPHSSRGFRRALRASQARGNRLRDQLPDKQDFSGPGYNKPNYFGQGGKRRGLHIGSGAPFTGPAAGDAGASFGGS